MTQLVALAYADEHRAAEVLATLHRLRTGALIDAQDVVSVVRATDWGITTGNVWEWTSDWYGATHESDHACCAPHPVGGERERSVDPEYPESRIPRRVIKGGSYLCAENYCRRYRPAARSPQQVDTPTCHLGFRCIVRPRSSAAANPGES